MLYNHGVESDYYCDSLMLPMMMMIIVVMVMMMMVTMMMTTMKMMAWKILWWRWDHFDVAYLPGTVPWPQRCDGWWFHKKSFRVHVFQCLRNGKRSSLQNLRHIWWRESWQNFLLMIMLMTVTFFMWWWLHCLQFVILSFFPSGLFTRLHLVNALILNSS